jgi:hypothetical protein
MVECLRTPFDGGNVTGQHGGWPSPQPRSNQRDRDKLKAQAQASPEVIERELLEEAKRAERGELSDQEREALADKIADLAKEHLWRSHALAKIAMKVRTGRDH